jgi:hypothetical protein
LGSRLKFDDIRAIRTAIVVVDANQVSSVNFGQLADYIAMVGLAEVNLDQDHGDAPTILSVFANQGRTPEGLSSWDQAFLRALYTTHLEDRMQTSEMTTVMTKTLAP